MCASTYVQIPAGEREHLPAKGSMPAPAGLFARIDHTPDMRERISIMPTTNTGAERIFALGRFHE